MERKKKGKRKKKKEWEERENRKEKENKKKENKHWPRAWAWLLYSWCRRLVPMSTVGTDGCDPCRHNVIFMILACYFYRKKSDNCPQLHDWLSVPWDSRRKTVGLKLSVPTEDRQLKKERKEKERKTRKEKERERTERKRKREREK